ncbi:MAG: hypothetical protein HFJ04_06055 [Lachnospiraceae bacterium]|nr:hypothetical protein [Lachnospiraceae bacterium]
MGKLWKKILLLISAIFTCMIVIGGGVKTYAEETIIPTYLGKNGNTSSASTYRYKLNVNRGKVIVPVQISHAGLAVFEVSPNFPTEGADTALGVVLSGGSAIDDSSDWLCVETSLDNQTVKVQGYAKGACTWNLIFLVMDDDLPDADVTVKAYQKAMDTGDSTLKKGKWDSYFIESDSTALYKIKTPSSGMLKLEVDIEKGSSIYNPVLLDSKGRSVLPGSYAKKVNYYGLKKGTYYLRIKNISLYKGGVCRMRYTFEKIKIASHTKKSNAINLKKGKAVKGIFLPGNKKAEHWYKVNISQNQMATVTASTKSNTKNFSLSIYQENGKSVKKFSLKNSKTQKKVRLKTGMYYFVIKGSSTGSYSVQWK